MRPFAPLWPAARALLLAAVVVSMSSAPASAAKLRHCSDALLKNPDGTVYNRARMLLVSGVSCKTGQRVARAYMEGADSAGGPGRPLGYRCRPWRDGAGVDCRKGKALISWGDH
jgi:hypothetical protein